jgi:hypothetical protein
VEGIRAAGGGTGRIFFAYFLFVRAKESKAGYGAQRPAVDSNFCVICTETGGFRPARRLTFLARPRKVSKRRTPRHDRPYRGALSTGFSSGRDRKLALRASDIRPGKLQMKTLSFGDGVRGEKQISGFRFQVSGFRFQDFDLQPHVPPPERSGRFGRLCRKNVRSPQGKFFCGPETSAKWRESAQRAVALGAFSLLTFFLCAQKKVRRGTGRSARAFDSSFQIVEYL